MPSPNYADTNYHYAPGDEAMQSHTGNQNDSAPATPKWNRARSAHSAYADGTGKAADRFGQVPKHLALSEKGKDKAGKEMQNKLSRLQRSAPKTAAGLAKGKKSSIAGFALRLLAQIDLTTDWLFLLLFSFGLLKDIFDIVFAAAGTAASSWIPGLNVATAAIGMTISFVGDLLFLVLVATVLVLVGSSFKNRGMAKYLLGVAMEFIAEALPGISWLPWTVVYVFILYLCVLYDRAFRAPAEQPESTSQAEENTEESAGGGAPAEA
jgi:hypothetical protein